MTTYYKAWFHKYLLAISNDKKLLKCYLKEHRSLSRKEYDIEEVHFLVNKDHKRYLRPFYDYWLPQEDIQIIMNDSAFDAKNKIENLISHIEDFNACINKCTSKISLKGDDMIDSLNKIKNNPELMYELEQSARELHPLVHCNIVEYLGMLKTYDEISYYNQRFHDKMYEEG